MLYNNVTSFNIKTLGETNTPRRCTFCNNSASKRINITRNIMFGDKPASIRYQYHTCEKHADSVAEPPSWNEINSEITQVEINSNKVKIRSTAATLVVEANAENVPFVFDVPIRKVDLSTREMVVLYHNPWKNRTLCEHCIKGSDKEYLYVGWGKHRIQCDACRTEILESFPMLNIITEPIDLEHLRFETIINIPIDTVREILNKGESTVTIQVSRDDLRKHGGILRWCW